MGNTETLTTLGIMAVDMVGAIGGMEKSDPMYNVIVQRLDAINEAIEAIDRDMHLEMSNFQVLLVNKVSRMLDCGLVTRNPITDKVEYKNTEYTIEITFQTPWIKLINDTNNKVLLNHMIEGPCITGTLANEILITIGMDNN